MPKKDKPTQEITIPDPDLELDLKAHVVVETLPAAIIL